MSSVKDFNWTFWEPRKLTLCVNRYPNDGHVGRGSRFGYEILPTVSDPTSGWYRAPFWAVHEMVERDLIQAGVSDVWVGVVMGELGKWAD